MRKNNLFLLLLMALIVMSCSKDETTMGIPQEGNAIEFGTYVGRNAQTRASEFKTSNLASEGFGVFAYYTETADFAVGTSTANFMNNQKVTGTLSGSEYNWTYSPIKYWPNNDGAKVTFLAYAPWETGKTITGGLVDFTVNSAILDQKDFVWNTTGQLNVTKKNLTGKVHFTFGHALARIGLSLVAAVDQVAEGGTLDANTTITVNSVTLSNAFYTAGKLNITNTTAATWTNPTGTQGFVFNTTVPNLQNNVITQNSHNTAKQLNLDNSYLMVIPQDFLSSGFDVTVDYNVVTTVPTGETSTGGGNSDIKNTITRNVKLNLLAGQAYTLKLHVGMNSIDITAEVTDWPAATDEVVNVPVNTN